MLNSFVFNYQHFLRDGRASKIWIELEFKFFWVQNWRLWPTLSQQWDFAHFMNKIPVKFYLLAINWKRKQNKWKVQCHEASFPSCEDRCPYFLSLKLRKSKQREKGMTPTILSSYSLLVKHNSKSHPNSSLKGRQLMA